MSPAPEKRTAWWTHVDRVRQSGEPIRIIHTTGLRCLQDSGWQLQCSRILSLLCEEVLGEISRIDPVVCATIVWRTSDRVNIGDLLDRDDGRNVRGGNVDRCNDIPELDRWRTEDSRHEGLWYGCKEPEDNPTEIGRDD